jgi:enamine deaminase RidA (YjgF/YER057c/UK114 family)
MPKMKCVAFLLAFGISAVCNAQSAEKRLIELGIELPVSTPPIANYVKFKKVGNLLFLAGHVPSTKGKLGKEVSLQEGYHAARETAISLLATINAATGDLDKVVQIIKVDGMVNCTDDFYDQSKVINGCSDLLVEVFGEKGKHARTAVGHNALPGNYSVEISAIVEIDPNL